MAILGNMTVRIVIVREEIIKMFTYKMLIVMLLLNNLIVCTSCVREEAPTFSKGNSEIQAKTPQELFELYIKLEQTFDSAAADLYSDDAVIRNTRIYPTGQQRVMEMPAPKYKSLIRKSMPLAKVRGDTNSYKDVIYTTEGTSIRITATRHSNLKNYDSPISILVSQDNKGSWIIVEEISQSQP